MKSIFQTKTFWFNVIYTLIETSVYLTDVVPVKYLPLFTGVQAIGNIIIRIWTTQPVYVTKPE